MGVWKLTCFDWGGLKLYWGLWLLGLEHAAGERKGCILVGEVGELLLRIEVVSCTPDRVTGVNAL